MVRLEFQENIKLLTVSPNNIFDQTYFLNLIRTSLCNSRKGFVYSSWCICLYCFQGDTIPINHARPNRNLSFTKKEPIG